MSFSTINETVCYMWVSVLSGCLGRGVALDHYHYYHYHHHHHHSNHLTPTQTTTTTTITPTIITTNHYYYHKPYHQHFYLYYHYQAAANTTSVSYESMTPTKRLGKKQNICSSITLLVKTFSAFTSQQMIGF